MILLLLVAITVTVVYIMLKWKISPANINVENGSKNMSVDKNKADDNIVTNINPAYKSVRHQRARVTANHDFEEVYVRHISTTGVGDTTTDAEQQQESHYENQDPELKTAKNVAYQPSTIVHLSMEYCDESKRAFNVNSQATHCDEDYI